MSDFQYTPAQHQAVYTRGTNLLVSAAAGSGKTMVLVDRILSLMIQERVELKSMLIVTFTNAAAAQMKDKIRGKLEEVIRGAEEPDPFLLRQLREINSAQISTMHSYCMDQLRKYYQYLQIDPNFRIIRSAQEAVLRQEAMDEALEGEYKERKEDFVALLKGYGGRRGEKLPQLLEDLYYRIQAQIDPLGWLRDQVELYRKAAEDQTADLIRGDLMGEIETQLLRARDRLQEALTIAESPGGPSAYGDNLARELEQLRALETDLLSLSPQTALERIQQIEFARLKPAKEADEDKKNAAKDLRDAVKKDLKALLQDLGEKSPERILREFVLSHGYLKTIYRILCHFDQLFEGKRREQRSLNFSDVEHLMVRLLEEENIREQIRSGISYIFFDEYQDINPLQEHIIEQIQGEENLFFVGDIKQSIYSFRLSDPRLFTARYGDYQRDGNRGTAVDLSHNFRSAPSILEYCNRIFSELMSEDLGEIDYRQPGQALIPGKAEDGEGNGVKLLLTEGIGSQPGDQLNPNAVAIAEEIQRLVEGGYVYRDIVLLMRSVRSKISGYEEAFGAYGIPYFSDTSTVRLTDIEVSTYIDMLRILNNEKNDPALITVLLSPMGRCSEEDLATIRATNREGTFYEAIVSYSQTAAEGDPILHELRSFQNRIAKYREDLLQMSLADFAIYFAEDSGYMAFLEVQPKGLNKVENLKAFLQRVQEYDQISHTGLVGLLKYVDKLLQMPGDSLEPSQLLGDEDDVVRIMSIHKSKGLEFPVVFLSEMQSRFHMMDLNGPLILDNQLGIGMNVVDPKLDIKYDSLRKMRIRGQLRRSIRSEEVRLLYVAMTRAIEKLILVGSVKSLGDYLEGKAAEPLGLSLEKSSNFLDWVCSIAAKDPQLCPVEGSIGTSPYSVLLREYEPLSTQRKTPILGIEMEPELKDEAKLYFDRRFHYQYPHQEDTILPYKKTVSELTQRNQTKSLDLADFPFYFSSQASSRGIGERIPRFLQGIRDFTKAEIGSITHFVLQNISLARHDPQSVDAELDRLVFQELLTPEERIVIVTERIAAFFSSDLGERMMRSSEIRRETSFTMRVTDPADGREIYVDGQIDCYFLEEGGYVLFDFKTDARIDPEKYRMQLDFYQRALELATGIPVKERYLYWTEFSEASPG